MINQAITDSPTGLRTVIENSSSMKASNFEKMDDEIEAQFNKKGSLEAVLEIATKNATKYNLSAANTSNLMVYVHATFDTLDALKSSKSDKNPLLHLAEARVGVCNNLTAYSYALLSQNSLFKNSLMVPALIQDHVVLLIRFSDISKNDYILDTWLPYTTTDAGATINPKLAYFGTVTDYLTYIKSSKVPSNDYIQKSSLPAKDAFVTSLAEKLNDAEDSEIFASMWDMYYIDTTQSSKISSVAKMLTTMSKQ